MLSKQIKDRIGNIQGNIGIYYKDLKSGRTCIEGNSEKFISAGLAKVHILLEVFNQLEQGKFKKDDIYILKNTDKMPSIGAVMHMHEGTELTIEDLYKLMISIGDNSAFNILVNLLGIDSINKTLDELGFVISRVNRLLYSYDAMSKGVENYTSIHEIGDIFDRLYNQQIISRKASNEIIEVLKLQQRNFIIPYYFGLNTIIAHQVGEDDECIHDAGIVYSMNPFILCMSADNVDVKKAESAMRDIALMSFKHSNRLN